jgi:hypothetical protein
LDGVETRELCALLDVGYRDLGARMRVYSHDSRICRYVLGHLISDEHMFVIVGLADTHDRVGGDTDVLLESSFCHTLHVYI